MLRIMTQGYKINFRTEKEHWILFKKHCEAQGTSASKLLNNFIKETIATTENKENIEEDVVQKDDKKDKSNIEDNNKTEDKSDRLIENDDYLVKKIEETIEKIIQTSMKSRIDKIIKDSLSRSKIKTPNEIDNKYYCQEKQSDGSTLYIGLIDRKLTKVEDVLFATKYKTRGSARSAISRLKKREKWNGEIAIFN